MNGLMEHPEGRRVAASIMRSFGRSLASLARKGPRQSVPGGQERVDALSALCLALVLALDASTRDIAAMISRTQSTVSWHVKRAMGLYHTDPHFHAAFTEATGIHVPSIQEHYESLRRSRAARTSRRRLLTLRIRGARHSRTRVPAR